MTYIYFPLLFGLLITRTLSDVIMQMKHYARRTRPSPYFKAGANLARYAVKNIAKRYIRTRTEQSRSSNEPLTGQFDYKTDYLKRRVSRKSRFRMKRARKFSNRIMKTVNDRNTSSVHLVRRSVASIPTAVDVSDASAWGLMSLDGTTGLFNTCNDLGQFLNQKDPTSFGNWNGSANQVIDYFIYVKHATMEHTIRNTGANDAIVEIYYIVGRRKLASIFGAGNPNEVYQQAFNKQGVAQDPDTGATFPNQLAYSQIGITPFQAAWFTKHYKIYKRTKFRVPPGNEINVVLHARNKYFNVSNVKNFVTDHRYHGILIQQQGSPLGTGAGQFAQSTTLAHLNIRRYTVKYIPNHAPQDALAT